MPVPLAQNRTIAVSISSLSPTDIQLQRGQGLSYAPAVAVVQIQQNAHQGSEDDGKDHSGHILHSIYGTTICFLPIGIISPMG